MVKEIMIKLHNTMQNASILTFSNFIDLSKIQRLVIFVEMQVDHGASNSGSEIETKPLDREQDLFAIK